MPNDFGPGAMPSIRICKYEVAIEIGEVKYILDRGSVYEDRNPNLDLYNGDRDCLRMESKIGTASNRAEFHKVVLEYIFAQAYELEHQIKNWTTPSDDD